MAEAGRDRIGPLVLAMLLASAGPTAWAQTAEIAGEALDAPALGQTQDRTGQRDNNRDSGPSREQGRGLDRGRGRGGSISGRLTDLGSTPLAGATVIARNEATGAEAQTITTKNGSYRLKGLEAGLYTLEATSPMLGRGRLQGVFVAGGGYEARVQAAMALEPISPIAADAVAVARQPALAPTTSDAPEVPAAAGQLAMGGRDMLNLPRIMRDSAPISPATSEIPVVARRPSRAGRDEQDLPRIMRDSACVEIALASIAPLPTPWREVALRGRPSRSVAAPVIAAELPKLVAAHASGPLPGVRVSGHVSSAVGGAGTAESIPAPRSAPAINNVPAMNSVPPRKREEVASAANVVAATPVARAAVATIPVPKKQAPLSPENTDPVTPVVGTTMQAAELQSLPASGRRWQDFLLDTPTAGTAGGERLGASLRGAGQLPAETSIDEMTTRLAFGGGGGAGPQSSGPGSNGQGGSDENGMGRTWAGGRGSPVAEAAVREVQTAAGNAEEEGSRNAGGQVNVDTTRGTNGLHGQGFLFDRQDTWGARNPFTQWVKQTAPATEVTTPAFTAEPYTPPDHETVWGVGLGSQIRRDKLFWFGAVDSYNRNDPGLATVKHPDEFFAQPSNDQMQVLSARLGLSSLNPVAEGLGAYSQMLGTLDGLLGPAPRTAAQWVGFTRIDWAASERQRFTLEGTGAHWNSPGGGLTRVSETYGSNSFGSSQASEFLLLGRWEAFLTPNLLAVTQGSMGRTIQSAHADTPSSYEQTLLGANTWGQLPQIVVDSRYGFTLGNPSRFGMGSYPDEHVLETREGVSWVRGNLLVKGGFEVSHNADATSLLRNETGTYSYSTAENFASDALVFGAYGLAGQENPNDQHNCDQTGKVWRDTAGTLHGLGYLPCYSYYSQTLGPTNWYLSTNDWAGFTTVQWQPHKLVVVSGGLRLEKEQLPPAIAALNNTELPLTEKMPLLGIDWGPRISVAVGNKESRWPVLRLGYGLYFGRTENATIETALTQTGSLKGDLNFFMRPTDNLNAGGAPPFPAVLTGPPGSVIKPGAVEFAPRFRNPEVHQAVASVEEELPAHVQVSASALVSLGRLLPISIDTNFDPAVNPGTLSYAVEDATGLGPIKTPQIKVPFYASWPTGKGPTGFAGRLNPDYQQITQIMSRANSTYEAMMLKVSLYRRKGLSFHGHYVYAHAADWNPNESTTVAGSDVFDPANFHAEYGISNLDMRHSAAVIAIAESPWKLGGLGGHLANDWMISGIGQFRSGMPYTMRTSGALAEEFDQQTGAAIVALGPGMNGSGGDNRVYGVGRNTFRYPATWKADMRVGKNIDMGHMRELQLLVESFNLFNHQNVTELETTGYYIEPGDLSGAPPTLNFLTGLKANTTEFGKPLNVNATNFYRERQIQVGVRIRF